LNGGNFHRVRKAIRIQGDGTEKYRIGRRQGANNRNKHKGEEENKRIIIIKKIKEGGTSRIASPWTLGWPTMRGQ
jgi:hypothetical protein